MEIHLRDNEPADILQVETMTQNILQSGMKAKAIHSSMGRAFIAESLGTLKAKERLSLVSQLAQNVSDIHKEETIVVIHQELMVDQLIDFELMNGIVETMKEMIGRFPDVIYAFENMPVANLEDGRIVARGSFYEDTPLLAEFLRNRLNTQRIGTVLYTCHMLTSLRVLASISAFGKDVSVTMSDFFDRFKESLSHAP